MNHTDFAAATFFGQCPNCAEAPMFSGWVTMREVCEHCGARFERWPGAAHGSVAFGYGVGAGVAAVVLVFLWSIGRLGEHAEFTIAGVAVVATLVTYRPVKGWWIAVLHSMGYVFPDPPEAPQAIPSEVAGSGA